MYSLGRSPRLKSNPDSTGVLEIGMRHRDRAPENITTQTPPPL